MRRSEENLEHILGVENQHESVAVARALCPFAEAATDEQMLMCVAVVEAKGDVKWVAEELGISVSRVRRQLQSRLSQQIIKALAKHLLMGDGYLKAVCALVDVASSESQTGTARKNAAQAIIELADAEAAKGGGSDDNTVDLNNMTLKQLEAYVGAIKQDLIRLPRTIDHQPID